MDLNQDHQRMPIMDKRQCRTINNIEFPIPHLGWNNIYSQNEENHTKDSIENNFYLLGFHVIPLENVEKQWVNYEFPMSGKQRNIHATQFHLEKSQSAGLEYLKNFPRPWQQIIPVLTFPTGLVLVKTKEFN